MGLNSYLYRKVNYTPDIPAQLGCAEGFNSTYVQELENGYVWDNKYYKTIEDLNKEFYQKIHIGKSSYGWHYALAIYPEYGINNLEDWKNLFSNKNNYILDEENRKVSAEEMLDSIINRKHKGISEFKTLEDFETAQLAIENDFNKKFLNFRYYYTTYDELLAANHAQRGLNGLWAHTEDKFITRTTGTYDYIKSGNNADEGEIFS